MRHRYKQKEGRSGRGPNAQHPFDIVFYNRAQYYQYFGDALFDVHIARARVQLSLPGATAALRWCAVRLSDLMKIFQHLQDRRTCRQVSAEQAFDHPVLLSKECGKCDVCEGNTKVDVVEILDEAIKTKIYQTLNRSAHSIPLNEVVNLLKTLNLFTTVAVLESVVDQLVANKALTLSLDTSNIKTKIKRVRTSSGGSGGGGGGGGGSARDVTIGNQTYRRSKARVVFSVDTTVTKRCANIRYWCQPLKRQPKSAA